MTSASVSCVIVAYHRPQLLAALLDALRHPGIELVVVNVDADAAVAALAARAGAVHVAVHDNPGYGAAVNRGAAHASTDVVVFLNDDVEVDAHAVLALADLVASGPTDVAVPRVCSTTGVVERTIAALPTPGSLAKEWLLLPDRPVPVLRRLLHVQKWRLPDAPEGIDAASALLVAVRTDLLRAVPLPEAYFLYWEESEWFTTLRRRGSRVQYRPDVTAVHHGGRDDLRPEKSRLLARNAVRCVRRTQGRAASLVALVVVVAWNLRLLAVACLLRRGQVGVRLAGLGGAVGAWREVAGRHP